MRYVTVPTWVAEAEPVVLRTRYDWNVRGARPSPCEFTTLAVDPFDRIVGFQSFHVRHRAVKSQLTWVARRCRGQGIGSRLWAESLRFVGAGAMRGFGVSDRGRALLRSLARKGLTNAP